MIFASMRKSAWLASLQVEAPPLPNPGTEWLCRPNNGCDPSNKGRGPSNFAAIGLAVGQFPPATVDQRRGPARSSIGGIVCCVPVGYTGTQRYRCQILQWFCPALRRLDRRCRLPWTSLGPPWRQGASRAGRIHIEHVGALQRSF